MADDQDIENILLDEEEDTPVDLSTGVQEPVYNQDILQASQIMDFYFYSSEKCHEPNKQPKLRLANLGTKQI